MKKTLLFFLGVMCMTVSVCISARAQEIRVSILATSRCLLVEQSIVLTTIVTGAPEPLVYHWQYRVNGDTIPIPDSIRSQLNITNFPEMERYYQSFVIIGDSTYYSDWVCIRHCGVLPVKFLSLSGFITDDGYGNIDIQSDGYDKVFLQSLGMDGQYWNNLAEVTGRSIYITSEKITTMPTYYRLKTISYEGVIGYSKMIHLQKTAQGIVDLNKKFEGKLVITASGAEIRRFNQSVYHGNIKQMFNELTERSPSGMYSMVFFQYGAVETKTFKK